MRPEFQRDHWSLAIGIAALAAAMLSGALHKAGVPGRDVIGVAMTFAIATGLTIAIAEFIERLGRLKVRRAASSDRRASQRAEPPPGLQEKAPQRPIEAPSEREQRGHSNDQGVERDHDGD